MGVKMGELSLVLRSLQDEGENATARATAKMPRPRSPELHPRHPGQRLIKERHAQAAGSRQARDLVDARTGRTMVELDAALTQGSRCQGESETQRQQGTSFTRTYPSVPQ